MALLAASLAWGPLEGASARDGSTGDWRHFEAAAGPDRRVVDQREWAARLVEALGLADTLPPDHGPDDVFSLLCPARMEHRVREGGRRVPARPPFHVQIDDPTARADTPLRMVVGVPATGLYALRVTGRGNGHWAVDRKELGGVDPTLLGADVADTLVPLSRGPHEIEARLADRSQVERLELTAFRPLCIAPAGGWGGSGPLRFAAKARTMVSAFGLEGRLPALGDPIVIEGESFEDGDSNARRTNREVEDPASEGAWAAAEDGPAELVWRFRIEEPGLFTILTRIHGGSRQLWSVDGFLEMRHSPEEDASGFAWGEVTTIPLDGGEHVLRSRIAAGSGVDRIHLVRRRTRDSDYIDLLEGLGFREGAPGDVVDAAAANSNLTNPTFDVLVADLLRRVGGSPTDSLAVLADELDEHFQRPLSPFLPADLNP